MGRRVTTQRLLYALSLVVGAKNIWQAMRILSRILRRYLFRKYKLFYYRNTLDVSDEDLTCEGIPPIEFQTISSFEQLVASNYASTDARIMEYIDDSRLLLKKSGILLVGTIDESVVAVSSIDFKPQIKRPFFPMIEESAFIYQCLVSENYRRLGIYSRILLYAIGYLKKVGLQDAYISCWDWNYPSRRGIAKAGFLYIGRGQYGRKDKTVWYQHQQAVSEEYL